MKIKKLHDDDTFKNTIVESTFYKLDASEDNTILTRKGNLLIIPSGSLLDQKGKRVNDSIQLEFAEGSDLDEIILSNLMIQDSALIYESYLSFFVNATRKGKQLYIDPDNPIYLELAADKKVSLYKGNRDKLGNMSWKKDRDPVDYLIPVAIDMLDFFPGGFESAVEKGLPYRNHEFVTKEFLDSLYYSFATELTETDGYFGSSRFLMIGLFMPVIHLLDQEPSLLHMSDTSASSHEESLCGINPASIKAICNKKFQNTLISTREFERRLKVIFSTCDNSILELYVNNLNKNLWQIDKMAANKLGSTHHAYSKFIEFAAYRQTTVKLSDRKALLLADYYKKSKENIERDLITFKRKYVEERQKFDRVVQEKTEEYRKLLEARHTFRMNKFGFELTNFGWYNAVRELKLSEVEQFTLNISIENGDRYDRVYAYVINPKINSIFSYLSEDKKTFEIVYAEDPDLLLWKNQKFNVIGVGYDTDKIGYEIKECIQNPVVKVDLSLTAKDYKFFRKDIRDFSVGYKHENKIQVDLEYQAFFYKTQKSREKEQEEMIFINKLRKKIFPCCVSMEDAEW
ncbi:MAG: hypothetical protein JXR31_05450 [Prolixibacteraceae bacterium]|nr:hypothetical protein [Prolixibacteraceae bacterium]